MSSERIQLPDLLHRLDLKVGLEGELAQKQKNSVYQNGLFDSPDEKDKFSLYYEGEIKVLFICGFSGDMDIYRRILLPLIEYKEFQCCIYNNRGIPPSKAKKHKSQTIAMMAHDALLLTRHLGWQKLNVAAASMGAMIALEFACSYTDITQSLIVMCGTAGPFSPSFGSLKKYSANALTHNPQKIRENRAKLMHSDKFLNEQHHEYNDMTGLQWMSQEDQLNPYPCTKQPVPMLIQQLRAIIKHEVTKERLQEVKRNGLRCLVMHGTADSIIPFEHGVYISQNIGGVFIPFEDSGHNMFQCETYENPQRVMSIGINFLLNKPLKVEDYPGISAFDGIYGYVKEQYIQQTVLQEGSNQQQKEIISDQSNQPEEYPLKDQQQELNEKSIDQTEIHFKPEEQEESQESIFDQKQEHKEDQKEKIETPELENNDINDVKGNLEESPQIEQVDVQS